MNSPNKSATISVADFLFLPFFQTPLIPNSRKIGCISEQKNQQVVFLFSQFALSLSPQKNREEVVEI